MGNPRTAKMTAQELEDLHNAINTVADAMDEPTARFYFDLLEGDGLLVDCNDCACWVYPDQAACGNCGHVNGDPASGSTPDDRPMRVCDPCWGSNHERCDGGDPHDLEQPFCNCKRLLHPNVTATRPSTTPSTKETP